MGFLVILWMVLFALSGQHFITPVHAFFTIGNHHTTAVLARRRISYTQRNPARLLVGAAATTNKNNDNAPGELSLFPGMNRKELGEWLDRVPVYAVTEPNKEGIVLLKERENSNDIAYFFFSAETANAVYAPLREEKNKDMAAHLWDVTQYPLGVVWFELFQNPEPGIEYRLVPDATNLGGARKLLQEKQSKQNGGGTTPDEFQKAFNEIPVFIDQRLRIQTKEDGSGELVFPMYLSLEDLISTLQQASASSSAGEYDAALNVATLDALLGQMQETSENDFRKSVLVPPSPSSKTTAATTGSTPTIPYSIGKEDEPLRTPMAINGWDD